MSFRLSKLLRRGVERLSKTAVSDSDTKTETGLEDSSPLTIIESNDKEERGLEGPSSSLNSDHKTETSSDGPSPSLSTILNSNNKKETSLKGSSPPEIAILNGDNTTETGPELPSPSTILDSKNMTETGQEGPSKTSIIDSNNETHMNFYGSPTIYMGRGYELSTVPEAGTGLPLHKPEQLYLPRETGSENRGYRMRSISEEGEPPSMHTIPSPSTDRVSPRNNDICGNSQKTFRGARSRELSEMQFGKPRTQTISDADYLSRQSISARTAGQDSLFSNKGSSKYNLSKVTIQNLRFPEPVEKHVKTYMTSEKHNFSMNHNNAICLWYPFTGINLDEEVQEKHCTVGDVGRFNSKGGFDVMFNIFMTVEENRKMNYSPPTTFTPFQPDGELTLVHSVPEEESHFFISDDMISFGQPRSGTYSFRCIKQPRRPGSAILVAPGCSGAQFSEIAIAHLRTYLATHVTSWYDHKSYPNEQHQNLTSGQLKLICTCYKSKVWATAALPYSSIEKGTPECLLTAILSKSPEDADAYTWKAHPSFKHSRGSSKPDVKKIKYTVAVEVFELELPRGPLFGRSLSTFRFSRTRTSSIRSPS